MSESYDDEIMREFLTESREHLETIENDLLLIEKPDTPDKESLINTVFRAAHSIKGGAGFLGLATIKELAHKTENVLDRVRSGDIEPSPEVVNVLLQAFDRLRELLSDPANSDQESVEDLLTALEQLLEAYLNPEEKTALHQSVHVESPDQQYYIEVNKYDLEHSAREGYFVYLVRIDLLADVQAKGRRPWDMIMEINSAGTILASQLNLGAVGTLDDEPARTIPLEMLYASIVDPEFIDGLFEGVPKDQIFLVRDPSRPEKAFPPAPVPQEEPSADDSPEESKPAPEPGPPDETTPDPESTESQLDRKSPDTARVTRQPRESSSAATSVKAEETIRVSVPLLENLMNLAGELVLARNQLNEAIRMGDQRLTEGSSTRVSSVSSELQETIMQTRMQPVGNALTKLNRLVRDLIAANGKQIQLEITGAEVEMDKAIVEGIADPLTHMVRNAADHGIETPRQREAAGKPAAGVISFSARHEAGQVVMEIADDGKGMDPDAIAESAVRKGAVSAERVAELSDREKLGLIFHPGLSTATEITEVSGRGVGMDVVKTNIDRLGGQIDIDSKPGVGTLFRINLPLTLAIMPTLMVAAGQQLFAIPQVNVRELIRIPAGEVSRRVERISNRLAVTVRQKLLPLIYLPSVLADEESTIPADQTLHMVILQSANLTYAVVVDQLHDSEEIVVRPLGSHLKNCRQYAGATILGNGRVAMILDSAGLAEKARLSAMDDSERARQISAAAEQEAGTDQLQLLVFRNAPGEPCALPLHRIRRIERVEAAQIESLGGFRAMQYRGAQLPVVSLADTAAVSPTGDSENLIVLVMESTAGTEFGLLACLPVDVAEEALSIDRNHQQQGITGSVVLNGRTTLLIDPEQIAPAPRLHASPALTNAPPANVRAAPTPDASPPTSPDGPRQSILLAEDSGFFRQQLYSLLTNAGYAVTACEDGAAAWEVLQADSGAFQMVVTDIEMPRMDGLDLARRIRAHQPTEHLPIIAITTLADEDDFARGREAGINEYQIKLDPEELLRALREFFQPQVP